MSNLVVFAQSLPWWSVIPPVAFYLYVLFTYYGYEWRELPNSIRIAFNAMVMWLGIIIALKIVEILFA